MKLRKIPKNKVAGGRVRGQIGVGPQSQRRVSVIECAGAIVWRLKHDVLEVLLIHRPRYDDWSWPKGKVDPGETLPAAAVREVQEETGKAIHLGIPLPGLQYVTPEGELKRVHYWAARVASAKDPALSARMPVRAVDPTEVDEFKWLPVAQAVKKLSRPADRSPLGALEKAHRRGELDSRAVIVVRHGKALARAQWQGATDQRPLTPLGVAQAEALIPILASYGISHVVTSQWTRCAQTVAPYEQHTKIKSLHLEELTEASHERNPDLVSRAVNNLMLGSTPTVLCTHRPVLKTLFAGLTQWTTPDLAKALPRKDPYLAPGDAFVAHVIQGASTSTPAGATAGTVSGAAPEEHGPRIVGVELVRPILF